ncbi:hypothetical protein FRC05_006420 [Tulasnella sp. 425]|nr:hypothetical protein FRC05_006420 [Tulasnella sp. 425]
MLPVATNGIRLRSIISRVGWSRHVVVCLCQSRRDESDVDQPSANSFQAAATTTTPSSSSSPPTRPTTPISKVVPLLHLQTSPSRAELEVVVTCERSAHVLRRTCQLSQKIAQAPTSLGLPSTESIDAGHVTAVLERSMGTPQEFAQRPQYAQFGSTFSLLHAACRWFMSKKRCAKHNRILDVRASLVIRNLYDGVDEGEEEDPKNQDPEPDRENGMEMSRVPFSDLVKDFPNSYQCLAAVDQGVVVHGVLHLAEINALKRQIAELSEKLDGK